jgi:hypothetical protein
MFASIFTSIILIALVLLASIMPIITRILSLRSRGRLDIGRLDNWMFGRLHFLVGRPWWPWWGALRWSAVSKLVDKLVNLAA